MNMAMTINSPTITPATILTALPLPSSDVGLRTVMCVVQSHAHLQK